MKVTRWALCAPALALLGGCAARTPPATSPESSGTPPRIGFSIQAGAFANLDNAIRLRHSLSRRGLETFHFTASDGLHRVRFGSFETKGLAMRRAEALKAEHVIDRYYIVAPEPDRWPGGSTQLRDRIVDSAKGLLGTPYRWGGPSQQTGFDCSGLTMTAYRLNGLQLPRTSAAQYATGRAVHRRALKEADLVFFATERKGKPSHVGLYIGKGRFIHAPRRGQIVRIDELSERYYAEHFLAARSYLR